MQHRLMWLALPLAAVTLAVADDRTKFTPGDYDWPQWQEHRSQCPLLARPSATMAEGGRNSSGPRKGWATALRTPTISAGRICHGQPRSQGTRLRPVGEGRQGIVVHRVDPVRAGGGGYPGPRLLAHRRPGTGLCPRTGGRPRLPRSRYGKDRLATRFAKDFKGHRAAGVTASRR